MKESRYALWDSVAVLVIWACLIGFVAIMKNGVLVACAAVASIYFLPKSAQWVLLLMDNSGGSREKETVFGGVVEKGKLDVLHKIRYMKIRFDDKDLKGVYMAFMDAMPEGIADGERVVVHYLPKSKIITEIMKASTSE